MTMCNCNQGRLPCTCNTTIPFKREDRYVVVKLKKLTHMQERHLFSCIKGMDIKTVDSVVVENDWPEYEPVWQMIERRMNGQPSELSRITAERDQLQQDLTERDERLDKADDEFAILSLEAGQRMEMLEGLLLRWSLLLGITAPELANETQHALKPPARCQACAGEGVTHTGTDEAPTTICNRCDGLGHAPNLVTPTIAIPRGAGEYDGLDNGVD